MQIPQALFTPPSPQSRVSWSNFPLHCQHTWHFFRLGDRIDLRELQVSAKFNLIFSFNVLHIQLVFYNHFPLDCQKVEQYFIHLQDAEGYILSVLSSLQEMKGFTSDETILTFISSAETLLNTKYSEISATLTSFETSCGVTRPARLTSATTVKVTKSASTTKAVLTTITEGPTTMTTTQTTIRETTTIKQTSTKEDTMTMTTQSSTSSSTNPTTQQTTKRETTTGVSLGKFGSKTQTTLT